MILFGVLVVPVTLSGSALKHSPCGLVGGRSSFLSACLSMRSIRWPVQRGNRIRRSGYGAAFDALHDVALSRLSLDSANCHRKFRSSNKQTLVTRKPRHGYRALLRPVTALRVNRGFLVRPLAKAPRPVSPGRHTKSYALLLAPGPARQLMLANRVLPLLGVGAGADPRPMRSPRSSLARRQAAACTYGASACASPTRKRAGADLRLAFQWRIGSKLSGEAANSCVYPTVAVSNRAPLPCGFLSLQDASPTIGRAEARPSSIAVSCCAWALHFGGDPRLQLSALCFMQECETHSFRVVADAKILAPDFHRPAGLSARS